MLLPGSYSPTPTDILPVIGVGDAVTLDIIRHCSFNMGSVTENNNNINNNKFQ